MYWSELLAKLDAVRSGIRQIKNFSRTLVPEGHELLTQLSEIAASASVVEEKRTVTLDVGPDGKPIIPAALQDLFAIAPVTEEAVASASTRIDTKTNVTTRTPKQGTEMHVSMLPREDKHINRPPDLTEATKETVAE